MPVVTPVAAGSPDEAATSVVAPSDNAVSPNPTPTMMSDERTAESDTEPLEADESGDDDDDDDAGPAIDDEVPGIGEGDGTGFGDGLDEDDDVDEFDDIEEDDFDDDFDDDFEEELEDDYEIEIEDEISAEFGLSSGDEDLDIEEDGLGEFDDFENID